MKILVIKSLFVPDIEYIGINIESITRFISYLNTIKRHKIIMKIVGWINVSKYRNMEKLITEHINKIKKEQVDGIELEYELWGKNYGKIYLLKNIGLIYPLYKKCDYIMYADHDIIPHDNILTDFVMVNQMVDNKKIMMVSFDQLEDNRHNKVLYKNEISVNRRSYYYNNDNILVASGCFISDAHMFSLFGELHSNNVYGDEDILIGKLLNSYKYYNVISEQKVIHPFNNDEKYNKWKRDAIMKIINEMNE